MFSKSLLTFFCAVVVALSVQAQDRIEKNHERLRRIRDDILSMEKEINASKKKEATVLGQLNLLELDIDLANAVIQDQASTLTKKKREINKREKQLKESEAELVRLKDLLAKRVVYMYKYGRAKDVEVLLASKSLTDGLVWMEYQSRMAEHDLRTLRKIQEKSGQIARDRDRLARDLRESSNILTKKRKEENKLSVKKKQQQKILYKVRKSTNLLRDQLSAKEMAAAEIKRLIVELEKRPDRIPMVRPDTPFAELRGSMIWPVSGRIVARFGKYRHPELKTVTENIGIDIAAPAGRPVQVVASGQVTAITWQGGRGTIVIVSHYGGYYSVYTHLEEVRVDLMQNVDMGHVLGLVGESGSVDGPLLHFEIWQGTEKLNPESWLGK